jgi:hypothetical protein
MHIAFFIFLISNIGTALLPTGPPLIFGFLFALPSLIPVFALLSILFFSRYAQFRSGWR